MNDDRFPKERLFVNEAMYLMKGGGWGGAFALSSVERSFDSRLTSNLQRRSVATSYSEMLGDAQVRASSEYFEQSMLSASAHDAAVALGAVKVPYMTRILTANITPTATASGDLTKSSLKKTAVRPPGRLDLTSATMVDQAIMSFIVAAEEVFRISGASAIIERELRNACIAATNATMISWIIDQVGSNALAGSSDTTTDMKTALQAVVATGSEKLLAIMSPAMAIEASTLTDSGGTLVYPEMSATGGVLHGAVAIVSDQMPAANSSGEESLILLDASALAYASDGIELKMTSSGVIDLADAPDVDSPSYVSLFQQDLKALAAVRHIGWFLMRATGATVLTGCTWGAST